MVRLIGVEISMVVGIFVGEILGSGYVLVVGVKICSKG